MAAMAVALLTISPALGSGRAAPGQVDEPGPRLAQAVPSNPGVAPGSGVSGGGRSGGGISNPGVPPGGSQEQLRVQESIRRQQRLRENAMARKQAAQMQRQAEIKQRYYLERDPLEAKEAAREAQVWKGRKDQLDKQRERLVQPE